MPKHGIKYYPTTLEAIHLLVLYMFLEALVDFPLALIDYHYDSNWLGNPWISFSSGFVITTFIFVFGFRKTKSKFSEAFALKLFHPLLLIPLLFLLPALQYLVGLLNVEVDKVLPAPPWFWELFERVHENRFGFWGVVFKVAILAPVIEESLFRGIIMHGLMRNYPRVWAIFLSGLLFSVFHLNPWQMTYTFFLGLLLGWIMVRTRSLPLCILAHSLNNLLVLYSIRFETAISENSLFRMSREDNLLISACAIGVGILLVIAFTLKKKEKTATEQEDSPVPH